MKWSIILFCSIWVRRHHPLTLLLMCLPASAQPATVLSMLMSLLICSPPRPHVIVNQFRAEVAKSDLSLIRSGGGTVLQTYATPICFMSSDAPDAAPFCRVVLVVQPRDGATGKTTKSNEYVFHPLNLVVAEVHVLRGQQFEDRGTRYCYLTQYNIDALACHDAVVPTRSFFENPYVSCVGCESGNASSAEAGPTCESGNASSAQAGPMYFNISGAVQKGIDQFGSEALSKAASTSPSSDWAGEPGTVRERVNAGCYSSSSSVSRLPPIEDSQSGVAPLRAPSRHGVYPQGWEEGMPFEIPFVGEKLADRFVVDTEGISYFRGGSMVHYVSKCTDPIKVALEVVQLWRDAENPAVALTTACAQEALRQSRTIRL
jgi:hypothetical protein